MTWAFDFVNWVKNRWMCCDMMPNAMIFRMQSTIHVLLCSQWVLFFEYEVQFEYCCAPNKPLHSSFEREKTVNEFLLGLWICFRAYGWLLSWPRWKFLLWKYCNQVALQLFFQKVFHKLVFYSFWHQNRLWFIIKQTCAKSSELKHLWCFVQNIA